ncbi:MAG: oligosaccharide flippase family protein [Anaerolineae bacterium]|nr:oligosaccharide flippase family protein [Anaerolineae bacterium]
MIYLQADKLILGKMLGEAPTGWYSAAYVLYLLLIEVVSTPVLVASFPTLSRYYHSDPAALDRLLSRLVYAMVVLGVPLAVGGAFVAAPLLDFAYQGAYPESAPVLAALLWSLVFLYPGAVLAQMLIVEGRQARVMALRALSAGLAVALHVALIALLGHIGPAVAIVAIQAVLIGLAAWWLRARIARLGLGAYFFRVVISAAVMAAACALLRDTHVLLLIGAAATVYGAALVAVGGVRREDVALLRAALGR